MHTDHITTSHPDRVHDETTQDGVMIWHTTGPSGHRVHLYTPADPVELYPAAVDRLIDRLTTARTTMCACTRTPRP